MLPAKPVLPPNETPIPPVLLKTGPMSLRQLPLAVRRLFNRTLRANPAYRLRYFSDQQARAFLVRHFEADVVGAFDALRPGRRKTRMRVCACAECGCAVVGGCQDWSRRHACVRACACCVRGCVRACVRVRAWRWGCVCGVWGVCGMCVRCACDPPRRVVQGRPLPLRAALPQRRRVRRPHAVVRRSRLPNPPPRQPAAPHAHALALPNGAWGRRRTQSRWTHLGSTQSRSTGSYTPSSYGRYAQPLDRLVDRARDRLGLVRDLERPWEQSFHCLGRS